MKNYIRILFVYKNFTVKHRVFVKVENKNKKKVLKWFYILFDYILKLLQM